MALCGLEIPSTQFELCVLDYYFVLILINMLIIGPKLLLEETVGYIYRAVIVIVKFHSSVQHSLTESVRCI